LESVIFACFGSGLLLVFDGVGCPALKARTSRVFLCFRFALLGIFQEFQAGLDALKL
jgi:hypothetical protein